jgi:hypothetical protein
MPPLGWHPREHQEPMWNALAGGGKRVDVVAHRRWGKDEVALYWTSTAASQRKGNYWHLLPEASQGRKAIWEAVNPHTGRRRIEEAFPAKVRAGRDNEKMRIELFNGSTWQVAGSDNYDSLVGASPCGVVFSEWSLAKPEAWSYLRPILMENDGWALFLWTPRGRNHATRAFESRVLRPEWFTWRARADVTRVFTAEQLARERAEMIAETGSVEEGEARFAQEYLVDFEAAAPGTYYGSLLAQAQAAARIARVPYDPALKVDTAWDLGMHDYTSIWFFQQVGREVRAIDYFETSGEGLNAIVGQAIVSKPYVFGAHHLPHDVMARELGTGRSRYETLRGLGLFDIRVGEAANPDERINAARTMIPMTWFDAERCATGLERLRAYRKKWNASTSSYSGPLHDQASHAADAFGEFAAQRRGAAQAKAAPRRGPVGQMNWMG